MWYPFHPGMDATLGVQASMAAPTPVRKGTKCFLFHARIPKKGVFGVFLPYESMRTAAWPSMAEHGKNWHGFG